MFTKLTDFSYTRSIKEALGFYLAYLLLGIILGAIIGALYASFSLESSADFTEGYIAGQKAGAVVAIAYPLVLSYLVLSKKKLLGNFGYLLLGLLSAILAIFGGALLGLVPAAYLTTKKK